ncbi:VOC family protein [uncultured Paracoccus sp.]|uniref:VOC family protein n=1 Tax=uncultured Paracoccus sp. TaxID=189685 RepID=UPI002621DCE9|nr:VOC family protein [uncultured Paracoccus sp.]
MTTQTDQFDMKAAPMRIGTVRLKVRDLDAVSRFYQTVMGLTPLPADGPGVTLGTGTLRLLHLDAAPDADAADRRQAGLFHTAFLLPSRAELARWLAHAAEARVALQGASDHSVSEAIYLADPEGNGIEVYADRPPQRWRDEAGEVHMTTEPLDLQDLLKAAGTTPWAGYPDDGVIGHVHLQVGDTAEADRFYGGILGLDIAARYPGASFYGSGGYHHQLAGNVWSSRGAGVRPEGMAGLDAVELVLRDPGTADAITSRANDAGIAVETTDTALTLRDPWGTRITLRQ